MSVISPALHPTTATLPDTAHYDQLPQDARDAFDAALDAAHASSNYDAYYDHAADAAEAARVRLPHSREIERCTCACQCDLIFDGYYAAPCDTTVQCPACQDTHRLTGHE